MHRILLLLTLLSWIPVSAQIIISPLHYNSLQAEYAEQSMRMKTTAIANDTINIPFFDDFAANVGFSAVDTLWMPGGGAFINNSYPWGHPSYNVATFDGLNARGVPYNKSDIFAVGPTDSLTSRPINLSATATLNKPVYFKFFWQAGGIGEIPDEPSDSIRLQFKNNSGTWVTVWNKNNVPETDDSTFTSELISVSNSTYLYKGFQFRFQTFGKQSGNYDIWNIDYIMLDTGVIIPSGWTPDLTYRKASLSILKNYTSMPVWQYEANIPGETRDNLEVEVVNLRKEEYGYEFNQTKSFLKELLKPDSIQGFANPAIIPTILPQKSKVFSYPVEKNRILPNGQAKNFEYRTVVKPLLDPAKDSAFNFTGLKDQISDISFVQNDTITTFTKIRNYYSYDDGSAEAGIGVNQALGKIAVKYKLNVKDTINSILICFPDINKDFTGAGITIMVWTGIEAGKKSPTPLYYKTYPLKHDMALNGFVEFKIDQLVEIPANTEVFVGYQQSIAQPILVGFDRNIDTRDKIFYYTESAWHQYDQEYGSIMIRPTFRTSITTGITKPQNKGTLEANVYPNPSQGEVTVEGKIKTAVVYDLTGRQVFSTSFEEDDIFMDHQLNLSTLANGLYLLHLENATGSVVKKIYINK